MTNQPTCPRCGHEAHDPRTGFCWESRSRTKGYHCEFCCRAHGSTNQPTNERKE